MVVIRHDLCLLPQVYSISEQIETRRTHTAPEQSPSRLPPSGWPAERFFHVAILGAVDIVRISRKRPKLRLRTVHYFAAAGGQRGALCR